MAASTAAVLAAKGKTKTESYLDDNQKLSSAGAAASLKYAKPQDLPSFPSVGLSSKESSAGAAASLASANPKSVERWKPDPSASASAAAVLAKDVKSSEPWHPEISAAGSKAALLAHKEGGNVDIWRPEKSQAGNKAALQALKAGSGLSPKVELGNSEEGQKKSLMAATGAMSGSRKRAGSMPIPAGSVNDDASSAADALSAATTANRPTSKSPTASTQMSPSKSDRTYDLSRNNAYRDRYTSHPTIGPAADDKKRADVLKAAALSMAKQMYDIQQKSIDNAAGSSRSDSHQAAMSVHGRKSSVSTMNEGPQNLSQYNNLEEAARKLAAERLAKLQDEHASYRNYYGTNTPQKRLSMTGRMRRRASSDGDGVDADREQSRRIRSQMSLFNDKLAEVDAKKRQKDRDALLAVAQRNVRNSMNGMDEKVFAETGRIAPSMLSEWEAKARVAAEKESKSRMTNYGKVDIGGGKFLDQKDVDAVASRNVQPILDEINEKAEAERARLEEIRLDNEEKKRLADLQKSRDAELKGDQKRAKEIEKQEAKSKKEEEKSRKVEEKRLAKEEKGRSAAVASTDTGDDKASKQEKGVVNEQEAASGAGVVSSAEAATTSPTSPDSPKRMEDVAFVSSPKGDSKVKSWIKGKLQSRRLSKGQKSAPDGTSTTKDHLEDTGMVAGTNASTTSIEHRESSLHDVAMANADPSNGHKQQSETRKVERSASPDVSISPASEVESDRGRSGFRRHVSTKDEDNEEARDHFDEEPAKPSFGTDSKTKGESPARDSRFHEEL